MSDSTIRRSATFGTLSLLALGASVFIGIGMTMSIASHTEEMASLGAIAGIGFGFIASIASLVLAIIGMRRKEKPGAPAFFGFILSAIPAAIGLWILIQMLVRWAGL